MTRFTRIAALLLAAVLLFLVLASAAVLLLHAEHDCVGEGCELCRLLVSAAKRLLQLCAVSVLLSLTSLVRAGAPRRLRAASAYGVRRATPVRLRVKLSN